jgi:hypothetical protein
VFHLSAPFPCDRAPRVTHMPRGRHAPNATTATTFQFLKLRVLAPADGTEAALLQ